MKKLYVGPILLATILLQTVGCGDPNGAGITSANSISGVAATGAPISGGSVEIKGSDGDTATATTNTDGTYEADVANLSEPFLVRVIAPSGEKYISVASASDLAEGKKINVTPLTHTIVANVFSNSDPDELFSNFQSESAEFTPQKLETEKSELVQKFIDAGLLGEGKIAGADIDLMNGEFVAGTSDGIDGLLDVIDVNTEATAGIEIKLKGTTTAIITDKVDGSSDPAPVAVTPTQLSGASKQLTILDELRAKMNALAALHSSKEICNGTPVDNGTSCDIDALHDAFAPFFHANYQEDGLTRESGIWGWFCRIGEEDEATSRAECLASGNIYFENVMLKDITLVHYNDTTKVALINFNFYIDGSLVGSEEMALKRALVDDTSAFGLLGNMKTFEYWIETESLYKTVYNKTSNSGNDSYSVNLKFYMDDDRSYNFAGNESLTLTALSGHQIFAGDSASMTLYLVVAPKFDANGACSAGVSFSTTQSPYRKFDQATGTWSYDTYANSCANSNPCNCVPASGGFAFFDHDTAQKVAMTVDQINRMDKSERIQMSGGSVTGDVFVIKKPLVVNQYNAPTFIPTFGMTAANFCENATFSTPLNLSVASGSLSYISIFHGFSDAGNTTWKNEQDKEELWDLGLQSYTWTPNFATAAGGDVIHHSHMYLSAKDEFDRQMVRQVECQE